jgi:DNA polymerase-3 subunit alpha (Gram-positive type)
MTVFVIFLLAVATSILVHFFRRKKAAKTNQGNITKRQLDTPAQQAPIANRGKKTFVVFDLETSGLSPDTSEIIEIAAIRYTIGEMTEFPALTALIKPRKKITKRITALTGITNELLEEKGEDLRAVLKDFFAFAGDATLVAHNAKFDMGFLHAACEQVGLPSPTNKVLCTLIMSREKWPGMPSYKLTELTKSTGTQAHRAMGDATRALTLFVSIHSNKS